MNHERCIRLFGILLRNLADGKAIQFPGEPYPYAMSEDGAVRFKYGNPGKEFITCEDLPVKYFLQKIDKMSDTDWFLLMASHMTVKELAGR